jgi:hypothetical protein
MAAAIVAALTGLTAAAPAAAYHDGSTGVVAEQLRAACPAFTSGEVRLMDTSAPPGNMPMIDIFEHESGARCSCMRSRAAKTMRCGPVAPARSAFRSG